MAPTNAVKVLEVCKVAPPPGSVSPTSLPLTFFDLMYLPLPPTQRLFFYDFPHTTSHFTNSLLPQLKYSLSLVLLHFFPMAGNMSWPVESYKPIINYIDGDSVSLTIAESNGDFHHLSSKQAIEAKESHPLVLTCRYPKPLSLLLHCKSPCSHPLVPHLPVSEATVPALALQVTLFPNSGICIGIITHHAIVDGKTAAHFMKSWASICKLGDTSLSTETLPFYDRTVIQDPDGIDKIFSEDLLKLFIPFESGTDPKNRRFKVMDLQVPPNRVRATFEVSRANLARLKEWILAKRKKDEHTLPIHLSTFVVTCAYIWVCWVKVGGEVRKGKTLFGFNVDCRARLQPQIPATYFGNCLRWCMVSGETSDMMREDGIVVATQLIGEAIRGLENGVLRGVERSLSELSGLDLRQVLSVAGSTRFRYYETDFGWGRPKKVELISIDKTGATCLADSCSGDGGVEIGLALDKQEMDAFTSCSSTVLILFSLCFNPSII